MDEDEIMPEQCVTSEIYGEFDYRTKKTPNIEGNVISEFPFLLPKSPSGANYDEDNDLDVERPQKEVIKIEHSPSTPIPLVGLQVWRGAFLLADLLVHLGLQGRLEHKQLLELGAGTGITSFVASIYARRVVCTGVILLADLLVHLGLQGRLEHKQLLALGAGTGITSYVASLYARRVVCTDIEVGGILGLIKMNAKNNSHLMKSEFNVLPLDFTETTWSQKLTREVENTDIILAADVIYDDDLTAAFVSTMQKILNTKPPKNIFLALEKRYVFTIEHMESVAPCYETFLSLLDKVKTENVNTTWKVEQLPLDFPKYFTYERVKELVLWKITSSKT